MGTGDGLAHAFGVHDDRLALADQFVDQGADLQFVVVVGAFQRRHFIMDKDFQLAGARDRPFDAVAHGGDFAADGLANAEDAFLGHVFRLGQTQGDFRHAPGNDAHFLRAPDHHGHDEEEDDGDDDADDGQDHFRRADQGLGIGQRSDLVGKRGHEEAAAERGPQGAEGEGAPERRGRGTALQGVDQVADVPAIIVGCRRASTAATAS